MSATVLNISYKNIIKLLGDNGIPKKILKGGPKIISQYILAKNEAAILHTESRMIRFEIENLKYLRESYNSYDEFLEETYNGRTENVQGIDIPYCIIKAGNDCIEVYIDMAKELEWRKKHSMMLAILIATMGEDPDEELYS